MSIGQTRTRYLLLLFVVVLFVGTGCSTTVEFALKGKSDMNNGGNAAVLKVYQLKAEQNFKGVLPSSFWRDDQQALGNTLLGSPKKVTIYPSEAETFELTLADKTKFVGVAANLRDPERDQWRAIEKVKSMGDQVAVTVKNKKIDVEFEGKGVMGLIDQ